MTIIEEVRTLNIPQGQYCVIGSGVMSAHGIREHRDIDLLVTRNLFDDLVERGWKIRRVNLALVVAEWGSVEASPDMVTLPNYQPDTTAIIARSNICDGIAFMTLSDLIAFKTALGRAKDVSDLALIAAHQLSPCSMCGSVKQ